MRIATRGDLSAIAEMSDSPRNEQRMPTSVGVGVGFGVGVGVGVGERNQIPSDSSSRF